MGWRGEAPAIVSRAGNQSQGYYAGLGPLNGGTGSGMGVSVAGAGSLAAGQGVNIAGQNWHPTVLYLAALIIAEMFVFGFIGHLLSK
jgi:hypothetical protein